MKSIIYTVLGVGLMAGMFAPPPTLSAEPPPPPDSRYADRFDKSGKIDSINLKKGEIVVNDELFLLSKNARVYTIGGTPGLLNMLKQGARIAFNTTQQGNRGYLTVIEILMIQ